jgi:replicative DNA helicase
MSEKIQPQDLEAEQSILGAMMLSKEAVAIVAGQLRPECFYKDAHGHIFSAIIALYKHNEPIDLITVSDGLKKKNKLEEVGGRSYLAEIADTVPSTSNALKYAKIVLEKYTARRLIEAGSEMISDAFEDSNPVDSILESAQRRIIDISKDRIEEDFVHIESVLSTVFENIQSLVDGKGETLLGVPSGFKDFDAITAGFQKSDLIILAARPAMGKTTLVMNIATNVAVRHKIPVAVFSLEMPKEQLAMRLLSSESGLDLKHLRTGNLHEHQYKNLMHGLGVLSEAPIYIDDTPGISPLDLRAKTRRLQMEAGSVGLIIIDYMQLMKSGAKKVESRFQEVSEIVREVKAFAKESQIPIIALSQLSRAVEQRTDKRPMLSDLRESGEIEQTADLVLFIHREDYYEISEKQPNQASPSDLIIAKHRNGPTGEIKLMFRKDISKFMSVDRHPAPVAPPPA